MGVGMGFTASDGVPTAVAAAAVVSEATHRAELLSVCCHELCELSIDATNGEDHQTMDAAMSGVIWSEHVVERRRTEVFTSKAWPRSAVDRQLLAGLWDDYVAEFPCLVVLAVQNSEVPDRVYGHWQMITREVVCTYGRAQGGDEEEERELEAFLDLQPANLVNAWLDLMIFCDRAFDRPKAGREMLCAIGQEGWHRVYNALRDAFNRAHEAAQRHGSGVAGEQSDPAAGQGE
jgi:hypothetical protein